MSRLELMSLFPDGGRLGWRQNRTVTNAPSVRG